MAIFKKGDNWYIDYYLKGHRKRKKIGPSKKLALQVLKDFQTKIAKGEYLGIYEEKKIRFNIYAEQYLNYSKVNKAPSTYKRHDKVNIAHLKSFFNDMYVFEITPQLIEKYKAIRLEKVAPATVNRELANLKHMFTKAIEWDYVKTNPVKRVKSLKEPPGRLRYLKPTEFEALFNSCVDYIRPILVTALNTGMRKSEILRLKRANVDLKNLKITVLEAKNNESRIVPINETLYQELLSLLGKTTGEYVFTARNGHPIGDIKKGFLAAVRRAGLEDFRFHDLRHTFGSYIVMQGADLRTVQQIMGHKNIRMTLRYAHLSSRHVQEAVETLNNIWTLSGHQDSLSEKEKHVTN